MPRSASADGSRYQAGAGQDQQRAHPVDGKQFGGPGHRTTPCCGFQLTVRRAALKSRKPPPEALNRANGSPAVGRQKSSRNTREPRQLGPRRKRGPFFVSTRNSKLSAIADLESLPARRYEISIFSSAVILSKLGAKRQAPPKDLRLPLAQHRSARTWVPLSLPWAKPKGLASETWETSTPSQPPSHLPGDRRIAPPLPALASIQRLEPQVIRPARPLRERTAEEPAAAEAPPAQSVAPQKCEGLPLFREAPSHLAKPVNPCGPFPASTNRKLSGSPGPGFVRARPPRSARDRGSPHSPGSWRTPEASASY